MAGFLTNSGLAKLAVATPLTPMTVKYMAFDAGQGTATPTMTALFNEVYRTEIPNPVKDTSTPKNLTFSGFVPTTVGGWTAYGVGLFDSLNVLVAYLQLAEPVTKSDPSSALKMSWQQDFIITLANAGETDLIITDSIEFRHDALTNRGAPDSHPVAAITGLQTVLDNQAIHNNLTGRSTGDAHPISAITGLSTALDNANTGVSDANTSINLDRQYKKITADYTILNTDGGLIEVDASAGNITITVAKSTSHISKKFLIIRTDDTANTVAVTPSSGDSFNGEGISYSSGGLSRYESILWVAGENYWTGVRSIGASTADKKGTVQLATAAETQAGANSTKAITPSTLKAGLGASGNAPTFAARAWVNFNGANGAIRASGNVASVVRNGVGNYTINFTTAMPIANYAPQTTMSSYEAGAGFGVVSQALGSITLQATYGGDNTVGAFDPSICSLTVFC